VQASVLRAEVGQDVNGDVNSHVRPSQYKLNRQEFQTILNYAALNTYFKRLFLFGLLLTSHLHINPNTLPKPLLFDESEVLNRLADGSEEAFNQIYNYYSPIVYAEALRFLRSSELAKDLVQELFITIWDKRGMFTGVECLTAYLLTMSKNLAYQYWLKISKEHVAKKEMVVRIKSQEQVIENGLEGKELETLLERALEQLPRQQKQVFQLAKTQGMSYKAISELLNISPNTVRNHITAANQFIRKRLGYASSVILLFFTIVYQLLTR